jgi:hypothetical protein
MLYIPGRVQTYNLKKVSAYNNFFADSYLAHNKENTTTTGLNGATDLNHDNTYICNGDTQCGSQGGGGDGGVAAALAAPVCNPACADNQVCGADGKCTAHPNCPALVKASVNPSTARPFDEVVVKCNYGKRMDCATVVGAGLKNCRYSRYEGTDNIFICEAGTNPGYYNDTKCALSSTTAAACCAKADKAGDLNVVGSEVNYTQDIVLPFGTYTLSARVFSVISKGSGVRVGLICNSDTCTTGTVKNALITSITFPENTDFETKSISVPLTGTGDDRHYLLDISVDKGSEAYFDLVSLKNTAGKEYVVNGDFANTVNGSITTKQPTSWGEGDNKVGYYYGSLADEEVSSGGTVVVVPTSGVGGATPVPGQKANITLNLKIKLQGVTKKPKVADAIQVLVKLDSASGAPVSKTTSFTVDDSGVWSGKVEFENMPTGAGYKVYIKAPKHIQKKICDAAPTETKGGLYHCGDGKITLAAGANSLDFSKIIQLAGDLPEGTAAKQNGIVDAYDTTFIRTNLGSTDATKGKTGDLNLDGVIDTQDYSMVLQSLSIKFDEE